MDACKKWLHLLRVSPIIIIGQSVCLDCLCVLFKSLLPVVCVLFVFSYARNGFMVKLNQRQKMVIRRVYALRSWDHDLSNGHEEKEYYRKLPFKPWRSKLCHHLTAGRRKYKRQTAIYYRPYRNVRMQRTYPEIEFIMTWYISHWDFYTAYIPCKVLYKVNCHLPIRYSIASHKARIKRA